MSQIFDWEFFPFRLDVINARLYRNVEVINLPPKAFDVLRYLVEHRGSLVTKERLLEVVWQNRVGDEVLKGRINELRKVLGDNPRAPRYIETVARRGYRFISHVTSIKDRRLRSSVTPAEASIDERWHLSTGAAQFYPDLCGEWELVVEFNGRTYVEQLRITAQCGCNFQGYLITPHPHGGAPTEQILRGELIDKFHAIYAYHAASSSLTECGTGIFVIEMDHQTMTGKSINIGFTAKAPSLAVFSAKKRVQNGNNGNRTSREAPGAAPDDSEMVVQ